MLTILYRVSLTLIKKSNIYPISTALNNFRTGSLNRLIVKLTELKTHIMQLISQDMGFLRARLFTDYTGVDSSAAKSTHRLSVFASGNKAECYGLAGLITNGTADIRLIFDPGFCIGRANQKIFHLIGRNLLRGFTI